MVTVGKANTSKDLKVQILMMDMFRAFDTVHICMLLEELEDILGPGELHIVKLRIEDMTLTAEVSRSRGQCVDKCRNTSR